MSSTKVAYDVLTPNLKAKPRFLAVPLDAKTDPDPSDGKFDLPDPDVALAWISAKIAKPCSVHTMFGDRTPDQQRQDLKDGMEKRVIEALK